MAGERKTQLDHTCEGDCAAASQGILCLGLVPGPQGTVRQHVIPPSRKAIHLVFEVAQDRFPESRLVTEKKTWLNKTLHCSFEALGVTVNEIKFFSLLS